MAADPPNHRQWLLFLLGLDLLFIALHLTYAYSPLLERTTFDITKDRGLAEIFQYGKSLWLAIAFLTIRRLRPTQGYGWWAALFGYLLLDDALELHEHGGRLLAGWLSLPPAFGLRAADFGELGATAIAATALLAPLLVSVVKGPPEYRRISGRLLILVGALGFCGVVVDMIHMLAVGRAGVDTVLLVLEDGGEMAVMSLICATVARERHRLRASDLGALVAAKSHDRVA